MSTSDNPNNTDGYVLMELSAARDRYRWIAFTVAALAMVFVALRVVARMKRGTRMRIDDWVLLGALVLLCGLFGIIMALINHGLDIYSPANVEGFYKALFAQQQFLTHTSGTIKVAVLLLYTHHITSPHFKIAANTVGFASIMYQVVFSLTALFQCRPIRAFWDHTIDGFCIDFRSELIAACVLDVIINSVVLCLPMPMLWSKTTLTRVRGALAAVFVLGCIVVFAGIYRLSKVFVIYQSDFSLTLADTSLWALIECSLAIIAACIPSIVAGWYVVRQRRQHGLKLNNVDDDQMVWGCGFDSAASTPRKEVHPSSESNKWNSTEGMVEVDLAPTRRGSIKV